MYEFRAIRISEITDGLSNTLLLGEIGRGPNGVDQCKWFVDWAWRVQRLASRGHQSSNVSQTSTPVAPTGQGNPPRDRTAELPWFWLLPCLRGELPLLRRQREVA